MRKKPSATFELIRRINLDAGLPTTGIDTLIQAEQAEDDELFALCLAALFELEKQSERLAITRH